MSADHADNTRRRELAKIHVAKKQLGLDDDTYRAMLQEVAGVDSSAKLDAKGRRALLEHMQGKGFAPKRGKLPHPGQPRDLHGESRGPLLKKIEAMLAEKGRVEAQYIPWSYALEILKRQGGPERMEWATPEQLSGVVSALYADAKRKGRRTTPNRRSSESKAKEA